MKIALVHDWLTGMRGGERCLEAFLELYPQADVITLVHRPGTTSELIDAHVSQRSVLNRVPGIGRLYRALLPLYPLAAASLDLSGYDLVISLSHAAAKNVRVPRGVPHVCYCFTPMRYIWDQAPYYFNGVKGVLAQPLLAALRRWDQHGAERVTHFVAISTFVAARIRRFYHRSAEVVAPPVRMRTEVDLALSAAEQRLFAAQREPFFLCAGALVPYKRIDLAVRAFSALGLPLWVVGGGSELEKLRAMAAPNVRFFGQVREAVLWESYRRCRALIFPGIEDFGISPVECLASGRPVVGVDAGGLRDSLPGWRPWMRAHLARDRECGVFIPKSGYGSVTALARAVEQFCAFEAAFDPAVACRQAARFSYPRFFRAWRRWALSVGIDPGEVPRQPGARSNPEGQPARGDKGQMAMIRTRAFGNGGS